MDRIALRDARSTYEEGLVFTRYLDWVAEGFNRFWIGKRITPIIGIAFSLPSHGYC